MDSHSWVTDGVSVPANVPASACVHDCHPNAAFGGAAKNGLLLHCLDCHPAHDIAHRQTHPFRCVPAGCFLGSVWSAMGATRPIFERRVHWEAPRSLGIAGGGRNADVMSNQHEVAPKQALLATLSPRGAMYVFPIPQNAPSNHCMFLCVAIIIFLLFFHHVSPPSHLSTEAPDGMTRLCTQTLPVLACDPGCCHLEP